MFAKTYGISSYFITSIMKSDPLLPCVKTGPSDGGVVSAVWVTIGTAPTHASVWEPVVRWAPTTLAWAANAAPATAALFMKSRRGTAHFLDRVFEGRVFDWFLDRATASLLLYEKHYSGRWNDLVLEAC